MDKPARNAPSATENPTYCASAAVPRQTAIATNRKSSGLQMDFTFRRRRGMTLSARKTKGTRSSTAFPRVQAALARTAEGREHNRHTDDGEVFDECDADHYAAIGCVHSSGIGEETREDHG